MRGESSRRGLPETGLARRLLSAAGDGRTGRFPGIARRPPRCGPERSTTGVAPAPAGWSARAPD